MQSPRLALALALALSACGTDPGGPSAAPAVPCGRPSGSDVWFPAECPSDSIEFCELPSGARCQQLGDPGCYPVDRASSECVDPESCEAVCVRRYEDGAEIFGRLICVPIDDVTEPDLVVCE